MDFAIVSRASRGPSQIQSNHVIWRSPRSVANETMSCDIPSDLSGSWLDNVVFKDGSTSVDSLSGMKSSSHEPEINPGTKAGDGGLPDACKKETMNEQAFLLKHGIWSVGSQGHIDRLCQPCHFMHTNKGCTAGSNCTFCHLPHVPQLNQSGNRPSKQRRRACKELLNSLHAQYGDQSDETSDVLKVVASQSVYMQKIATNKNQPKACEASAGNQARDPAVMRAQEAKQIVTECHCAKTAASSAGAATAPAKGSAARPGNFRKWVQSSRMFPGRF